MGMREKVAEAACNVPIRLGPNAIANAQNGHALRLSGGEAEQFADAVMEVVEGRLSELEAKAREDYSDDPWDHGYLRALKDMRGET